GRRPGRASSRVRQRPRVCRPRRRAGRTRRAPRARDRSRAPRGPAAPSRTRRLTHAGRRQHRVLAMTVMDRTPGARSTDVVAAFDFDGTLSTRDNVVPFLHRFVGTSAAARGLATGTLRVARSGHTQWSRDALKAAVLHELFAGRDAADLDDTA